jgi:hypothetical protein
MPHRSQLSWQRGIVSHAFLLREESRAEFDSSLLGSSGNFLDPRMQSIQRLQQLLPAPTGPGSGRFHVEEVLQAFQAAVLAFLGYWRSRARKANADANPRKPREGAVGRLTQTPAMTL